MKALDFIIQHWEYIAAIAYILIRLIPTQKNYDLFVELLKVLDRIVPNLKKGGGKFNLIIFFMLCSYAATAQVNTNARQIRFYPVTTATDTTASSANDGRMWYDFSTDEFRGIKEGTAFSFGGGSGSGGGGITNSAAANEMMKSDGTNAVASGVFSTTAGNLILGSTSLTGSRTISTVNTAGNSGLLLSSQGAGGVTITTATGSVGFTSNSISMTYTGSQLQLGSNTTLCVGTTAASRKISAVDVQASTNTTGYIARFQYETTGSPATGIGSGIEFAAETQAGNIEVAAAIEAVSTDVTSSSEDFDIVFKNMSGGAAAVEQFRIKSDGNIILPNLPTSNPGITNSVWNNGGMLVTGNSQYVLDENTTSTAGGTVTLDMNSQKQRMFVGSATFATSKTIALSNNTNALVFNFHFEVTNVAATLVMPSNFLMADSNFDTGTDTWTPPSTGKYEMGGSYDGTNWKIKILGPFL